MGMKRKKWSFMLIITLAVILFSPFGAMAAKPIEMSVEGSRVKKDTLQIYVNTSLKGKQALRKENYQISLGSREIPCKGAVRFSETGESVAYVFLMDVSGSISSEKLQRMKKFLSGMTAELGKKDQVCVATIGNNLSAGKFIRDQKKIKKEIQKIKGLSEDTNLYQGIVDSIKLLDSGEHGAAKKALVILSDGQDDQAKGITRKEVDDCLKEKHIPVYTAAMLDRAPTEKQLGFAKILGSFARESAGGFHTVLKGGSDAAVKKQAAKIPAAAGNGIVLSGDVSEYQPGNGQVYLQVTMQVKGTGKTSDGFLVSESSLGLSGDSGKDTAEPAGKEEEKATDPPAAATSSPPETKQEQKVKSPGWIPVAVCSALFLVVIVLILFLVAAKKKKASGVPVEQAPSGEIPLSAGNPAAYAGEGMEKLTEMPEQAPSGNADYKKERVFYLAKVGLQENQTYEIHIRGEVKFGRDSTRADYAFPEDILISGLHCSISVFDEDLVLCDQGSKNGTWVNGIPIKEPYVLKYDDVIQMGKTELRIYW